MYYDNFEYLIANAKNRKNEKAISTKDSDGTWNHISWSDFHDQTASVAKSLIALGFNEGEIN